MGQGEVRPDPLKLDAILAIPILVNITQVRAFMGLARYYRKFIPNFAGRARALTDLQSADAYDSRSGAILEGEVDGGV